MLMVSEVSPPGAQGGTGWVHRQVTPGGREGSQGPRHQAGVRSRIPSGRSEERRTVQKHGEWPAPGAGPRGGMYPGSLRCLSREQGCAGRRAQPRTELPPQTGSLDQNYEPSSQRLAAQQLSGGQDLRPRQCLSEEELSRASAHTGCCVPRPKLQGTG